MSSLPELIMKEDCFLHRCPRNRRGFPRGGVLPILAKEFLWTRFTVDLLQPPWSHSVNTNLAPTPVILKPSVYWTITFRNCPTLCHLPTISTAPLTAALVSLMLQVLTTGQTLTAAMIIYFLPTPGTILAVSSTNPAAPPTFLTLPVV